MPKQLNQKFDLMNSHLVSNKGRPYRFNSFLQISRSNHFLILLISRLLMYEEVINDKNKALLPFK